MQLPTSREEILILHNPKCSKSRATLALLETSGVEFEKRLYLEQPLGREELVDLGRRLGKEMLAFTRTKQSEFAEAGLSQDSPESEVLAAVVAKPILMERPIVVRGDRAAIGRPPEDVLALLEDEPEPGA
jgi:arsenate reductase